MNGTATPVVAAAAGILYAGNTRCGRGVPHVTGDYGSKCSCHRAKGIVFCQACGFHCNGRIRLPCKVHPRVLFLQDISVCHRCHSAAFLDQHMYSN